MSQITAEQRLERMEKKLDNIESALIGDAYGNKGYGKRISSLEHAIKCIDRKVWMSIGGLSVITFVINIIFAI